MTASDSCSGPVDNFGRRDEIRVHSFLDVTQHRIAPGDYERFRQFLGEIDAALATRITIRKSGS